MIKYINKLINSLMNLTFAEYRLEKELTNIQLLENFKLNKIDNLKYKLEINVDDGIYKGRILIFEIHFNDKYPFIGPKVYCKSKIFHPNVYNECMCLKILRDEWNCIYGLQEIIFNIYFNLIDLDPENPLNTVAGDMMVNDYPNFLERARNEK